MDWLIKMAAKGVEAALDEVVKRTRLASPLIFLAMASSVFAPDAALAQSPTNIFDPAATPAHSIFGLSMLVLSVTLGIFVTVAGLLLYALIRYRHRATDSAQEPAQIYGSNQRIHPQFVARTLSETADDDAIITYEVGTPTIWAARYIATNGRRRLLGSLNHGSMANALAQAIGAQTANPNQQVISFSGDGGLTMLMGDLLTLAQQNLPIKVVVLNNGTHTLGGASSRAACRNTARTGQDKDQPVASIRLRQS